LPNAAGAGFLMTLVIKIKIIKLDTGDKSLTNVVDTGDKLMTGINNTGDNFMTVFSDTVHKSLDTNI